MIRTGSDPRSTVRAPGDVGRAHPRRPQSGAALRRRARRGRPGREHRRPAAGHRRRRLGQDQHARPPGRAPDRARRRSSPHPAAHLLAARGRRDGAPGRAHRRCGAGRAGGRRAQPHSVVGHLPRHRRAAAADVRARDRARSRLHHPRPRGLGRPDEPRAPRARALRQGAALPPEGDLPRHLLARRQRRRAAGPSCCGKQFPWCAEWKDELRAPVRGLRRGQAEAARARLRRPAALLGRADGRARAGGARSARLFDHVLVDEYQDTNALQAAILLRPQARRRRPDRGRRRRAGDLRLPRRHRAQHPGLPGALPAAGRDRHAGAELPLDAADPGRVQRRHRPRARAVHQEPALAQGRRREACAGLGARRHRPGRLRRRPRSSRTAKPASRSRSRRCCSARRTTAPCSRSS